MATYRRIFLYYLFAVMVLSGSSFYSVNIYEGHCFFFSVYTVLCHLLQIKSLLIIIKTVMKLMLINDKNILNDNDIN